MSRRISNRRIAVGVAAAVLAIGGPIVSSVSAGGPCPWDTDDDGQVGITDFLAVLADWGPNPGSPADTDGNGEVDVLDFLGVLGNWGACP